MQLGALDATEIRDLQSNDFHSLACLFYWETPVYRCSLWRLSPLNVSLLYFTLSLSPRERQTCRPISLVLYLLRIPFLIGAQIERKISLANEDARSAGSAALH